MGYVALFAVLSLLFQPANAADPTAAEVKAALRNSVTFFQANCAKKGGYVWRYSRDLKLSEGEGPTDETMIWVQPPGTPAVGMVLLDAYTATGDDFYLSAAQRAADALARGQLQSGGWFYHIELHPEKRRTYGYRDNKSFRASPRKKNRTNITTLDDDNTQSVLRFLMRLDKQLGQQDRRVHEAVTFGLDALLAAQHPNGGWRQNWDRYPQAVSEKEFPVVKASYPKSWSRRWLNDWTGRYYINDNVMGDVITTLLQAWETYNDARYLASAKRAGEFLLLAQMPDPQPAWAQQYNAKMHPVWDRKFEPPAITGGESQNVMQSLLLLYDKTGERRFLKPIPRALDYLRKSQLSEGRLARFYELKTNRPLYFRREGKIYHLTYADDDLPTHYGFVVNARLDSIQRSYQRALKEGPSRVQVRAGAPSAGRVHAVIAAMDERGAWIDKRGMRGFNKASQEGVIQSETFIRNVSMLGRYLQSVR